MSDPLHAHQTITSQSHFSDQYSSVIRIVRDFWSKVDRKEDEVRCKSSHRFVVQLSEHICFTQKRTDNLDKLLELVIRISGRKSIEKRTRHSASFWVSPSRGLTLSLHTAPTPVQRCAQGGRGGIFFFLVVWKGGGGSCPKIRAVGGWIAASQRSASQSGRVNFVVRSILNLVFPFSGTSIHESHLQRQKLVGDSIEL